MLNGTVSLPQAGQDQKTKPCPVTERSFRCLVQLGLQTEIHLGGKEKSSHIPLLSLPLYPQPPFWGKADVECADTGEETWAGPGRPEPRNSGCGGSEPLRLDPGLPLPLRKEHCGRIPSDPSLSCVLHLTAQAADTPPFPSLFGEPGFSIFSPPSHLFLLLGSLRALPSPGPV